MNESQFITEERISFRVVIERIRSFVFHLFSLWRKIVIYSLVLSSLYISYELIRKPVFTAETTFVLESNDQSGMNQLASIASTAGFSFGAFGDEEGLFQTDNIKELYKSRRMLQATFYSIENLDGKEERLITRFARDKKLLKKWKRKLGSGFSFEVADSDLTLQHDSLMYEVLDEFRDEQLIVEKPDRKLSILSVRISDKDELFSKRFNEVLVEKVNQFYQETKTKKSGENLAILQNQADTAKARLNKALADLATASENTPNPNPLFQSSKVPIQKARIEVETNAAVYEELVKNLEIAKITHRNNMPLIQIIDQPILPLADDKDKKLKMILKGGFVSGLLVVFFFSILYIYRQAMTESAV